MLPVIRRLPRLDAPESIFTYASRLGAKVNGRETYPVALDRYLLIDVRVDRRMHQQTLGAPGARMTRLLLCPQVGIHLIEISRFELFLAVGITNEDAREL